MSLPDVTDADLQPGAKLLGKISGKLTLVYRCPPSPSKTVASTTALSSAAATTATTTAATANSAAKACARGGNTEISDSATAPAVNKLKFRLSTRLPCSSDYTVDDASPQPFGIDISLTATREVRSGSIERLMKVTQPGFIVDVTGLTVAKRGRDEDGRKIEIVLEGDRDVRVLNGGVEYVLFGT